MVQHSSRLLCNDETRTRNSVMRFHSVQCEGVRCVAVIDSIMHEEWRYRIMWRDWNVLGRIDFWFVVMMLI